MGNFVEPQCNPQRGVHRNLKGDLKKTPDADRMLLLNGEFVSLIMVAPQPGDMYKMIRYCSTCHPLREKWARIDIPSRNL